MTPRGSGMKRVNFFWKGQNPIIREILSSVKSVIQNYLWELLPQKQATPLVFGGNYARSSWMFESGFTGFIGLTITSLV